MLTLPDMQLAAEKSILAGSTSKSAEIANAVMRKEVAVMNGKVVKTIGIITSVAGFGLSLISDWVDESKMKNEVSEQVAKAVAEALKSKES